MPSWRDHDEAESFELAWLQHHYHQDKAEAVV